MSEKKIRFDARNRHQSWQTAEMLQAGVLRTAEAVDTQPAMTSHPVVGEIIPSPRRDLQVILTQFFTTLVFVKDMLEQLKAIEAHTGIIAADLIGPKTYAGLTIPDGTKRVEIEGDVLYAVSDTESSVVPGAKFEARTAIATVGSPAPVEVGAPAITAELLQQAKLAWEQNHRAAEPGVKSEGG